MESIGVGTAGWALSFLARRALAGDISHKDTNDVVRNAQEGSSKFKFFEGLIEREIKQDIFKMGLPLVGGIIAIIAGLCESSVDPQVSLGLLTTGALHVTEAMIYRKYRHKQYEDAGKK